MAPTIRKNTPPQDSNPFYSDDNISVLRQHLSHSVSQAAELRKHIADSKTITKRNYYQRKFDKINKEVIQSLAMIELMERAAKEVKDAESN